MKVEFGRRPNHVRLLDDYGVEAVLFQFVFM
jgi:hypothetical protein